MLSNRDGKITYSGVVGDESTRGAIVTALQSTFGQANVDGTLRVDPNVRPATWLPRLGGLLATVNAPGVDLSLNGDAVNVGGWLSDAQRQSVTEKLRGVVGATSTIGTLDDAAGDAVRAANDKARAALGAIGTSGVSSPAAVVQAMNLAILNFPTGSAQIPAANMDIIRQSAEALKRAPAGSRIEIGGHTDNTGDAAGNMALSQQRADAVRDALVSSGVPAAMLTTRGYGDTKPRAQNDTEYGRFQNRRIEYSVVQ
jgi:outer membrane protein OmpA-like peptidoglycan-associated protein